MLMPYLNGRYDFHSSLAPAASDSWDAPLPSPPSPPLFPHPPLSTAGSHASSRSASPLSAAGVSQPPLLACDPSTSAFGAASAQTLSTASSVFSPWSTQSFNRSLAPFPFAPSTCRTSHGVPRVSASVASTASTVSSSSSIASTSPQLPYTSRFPHTAAAAAYPFMSRPQGSAPSSGFELPVPAPSLIGYPAAEYEVSDEELEEEEEDEEEEDSSPPSSPALMRPSRQAGGIGVEVEMEHDDATDGHIATPVTRLLAAARASHGPVLPVQALGPRAVHYSLEHSSMHSASDTHVVSQLHSSSSARQSLTPRSVSHGHTSSHAHSNAQRISKACEACRRRKRRCDGLMPQCTSCVKVGVVCRYPQQTRRRGPQAGMVSRLRAQVSALQLELHKERSRNTSAAAAAVAAGNIAEHANVGLLLQRDEGESRALSYITVYFDLLNSTLFPFLVQSNFEADYVRYASNPSTAPPVWHLTVASVLAQGAAVSGNMEYSEEAALIARAAAAPLLDQPSADVVRGLLLLSYHCLSCNQLSRVSCFLAVATRMCAIVDMSPEVPLLCRWLEDMLCAIRTWWRGLRTMPEGSYQKEQRERFPADWARYEQLSAYLKVHQQLPQPSLHEVSQAPSSTSPLRSVTANASISSPSALPSLSLHGPPDSADLDDSNIRWELLSTLCGMSEARGEYSADTHLSVYHHLCVLSKAEYSPLTVGAVATTIAFLKSQALFFVNELGPAVEYARVCTRNMLTQDVSNCAFTSLVGHFMCQVHLKTADYAHLAIVLSAMKTCAARWKFAEAPLRNIEQVIQQQLTPLSPPFGSSEDEGLAGDFEPEHSLPLADRRKAEEYYQSSVIPTDELREKNRKRKLEREEAEARAATLQPPSPTILSALHAKYSFPSVADTIAAFHPAFKQAFYVSAAVSRGSEQDDKRHSPPVSTSKTSALRRAGGELRADHPHPQLSTLADSTFTLKREEIELGTTPELPTVPPAEQPKPLTHHVGGRSSATALPALEKRVDSLPSSTPSPPQPLTVTSAAPSSGYAPSALSAMPAVADTYAWQAGLFSPPVTAISSSAYSTAITSSYAAGYSHHHPPAPPPPPPSFTDHHAVPSFPVYSSPYSFARHLSVDSVTSAPSVPSYPYNFESQPATDASSAVHYYQRSPVDLQQQMTDDGGTVSRHPSLHTAPQLQMSHSTPVSAAGLYGPPSDTQHSPYTQPASLYNPMVQPPLPHALSAPLPPYLYNQHPAYGVPQQRRVSEVNAQYGHFSDPFAESKRRHHNHSTASSGSNNKAAK